MIFTKLKEIIKYPLTVAFAAFTLVMLAGYIIVPDTEFSETENRYLKSKPVVSVKALLDGTFMENFETYSEDQLPFRNELIKSKALCEMALYKCENNGIIRGDNGQLFEKTLAQSEQLEKNLMQIQNFIENSDREIYVAVAPTQVLINAEHLPTGAPVLDETEAGRQLGDILSKESKAHYIDLTKEFSGFSDKDDMYYKTDHHWNSTGAYKAYLSIAKNMNFSPIDIGSLKGNKVNDFYGTSYTKYKGLGIKPDTIDYYDVNIESYCCDDEIYQNLYDLDKITAYDKYALFMYGNPGKGVVKSKDCKNGKKLLILKDSYANSVIPFLTQSYEEISILDLRYFGGSVAKELSENQDADVLLLYNWSFMNSDNHFYKLMK